jgi:hypothetical protein
MGHLPSKARSQELKIDSVEAAVLIKIYWKMGRKIVLVMSRSSWNIGHLGSKRMSHSPNMENFY